MERTPEAFRILSREKVSKILQVIQEGVSNLSPYLEIVAFVVAVFGGVRATIKFKRRWPTRHLRKIWGLKDGDYVVVVCSELDDPEGRQRAGEAREFIYHLKYGDIDAYFEVVITLLRLFPRIKLHVFSSGETEHTRVDMAQHLILIGGPDYNAITRRFLEKGITHYAYRTPEEDASTVYPNEIVIYCGQDDQEHCESTDERDYGYFERIRNPNNPSKHIVLIGGCHTIGVTGAAKAYSMADNEQGEIRTIVLKNARKTAKKISRKSEFAVLVAAERTGQTISVPLVSESNIAARNVGCVRAVRQALARGVKRYLPGRN